MKPFIIPNELFKTDKDILLLQLLGFKGNVSSWNDTAKNKLIRSFFLHRHVHYPSSPSDHEKDIFILSLLDFDGAILEDDDFKEQCFNILLEERNIKAVMEFEHAANRSGVAEGLTTLHAGNTLGRSSGLEHSHPFANDGRVSGDLLALQQGRRSSNGVGGCVQTQAVHLNMAEGNQPGVAAPQSIALVSDRDYLSKVRFLYICACSCPILSHLRFAHLTYSSSNIFSSAEN